MNSGRRQALLLGAGTLAALGLGFGLRHARAPDTADSAEYLRGALGPGADDADFARATTRPQFSFPRDHGPHRDFRTEWWYFSGHLTTPALRWFGFQLTLFRFELARRRPVSPSAWRTPTVLLGHFAVTDIAGRRFHAFERMSRALPGIAGVADAPPAIWLDDWRIDLEPSTANWRLAARQSGVALELALQAAVAVVAHGDDGLSRKSAAPGNASYYYSIPRLTAHGRLTVPDGAYDVAGSAWLDREWSTSALDRAQIGWDWFALQLDDGANLMFYRLRERDGRAAPASAGSYVDARGVVHRLALGDVILEPRAHWLSPLSGRRYPTAWTLRLPRHDRALTLTPVVAAQEWRARFPYWEGAVIVNDAGNGTAQGRGYVELTGY